MTSGTPSDGLPAEGASGDRGRPPMWNLPWRWLTAVLVVVCIVVAAAGWMVLRHVDARQVTHHPVIAALEEQGWTKAIDRTHRPGPFDRFFLGGMVEHPLQRQILYRFEVDDLDTLQAEVEQELFGVSGSSPAGDGGGDLTSEFVAHGLRWERDVRDDVVRYTGVPGRPGGRLERVTVAVDRTGVSVRAFGR